MLSVKQALLTEDKHSIETRIAEGKALRNQFPREKQGIYQPAANRLDPISILEQQAKTRVPELVPIRYARMLTSPFAFLRGAAAIMAADLAASAPTCGIKVQTCGDAHMANFGVFASAERNIVFGINDFDETLPGPWEWDLKRLVASVVVGGRFLGANDKQCEAAVRATVASYRLRMKKFAYRGHLELWYYTITEDKILKTLTLAEQKRLQRLTMRARERTNLQVLGKMTDLVDNKIQIKVNVPFIVRATHSESGRQIEETLHMLLESYFKSLADDRKYLLKHYKIADVARKVVGVGSVGTRCWVIYLTGNDAEDPLFLQVKEAQTSVLEPYVGESDYSNHGQRVVAGQRLIQGAPDIFLGWGEQDGYHFYIRQLRDMKGGVEFDPSKVRLENFSAYVTLCAWALALSHAKSGDAARISGYVGNSTELDDAMVRFGFSYADQTKKDHEALVAAVKSGRIKAANSGS
jgi:uncharacterized protein (DUF2252 family)